MKRILTSTVVALLLSCTVLQAQVTIPNFGVAGANLTPSPATFPGGTETFIENFSVNNGPYTFSSDPFSNNYMQIVFSFTKLDASLSTPTGTGAALFNWHYSVNGTGGTWTGTSKDITMTNSVPFNYKITFSNMPVTAASTAAESNIGVGVNINEPAGVPSSPVNNTDVKYTYSMSTLPVSLLQFDAVKKSSTSFLTWSTAQELNSSHFAVQRSGTGTGFSEIGRVTAAGISSAVRSYNFTDAAPLPGSNYYRLQLVDADGSFSYSPVRLVNFGKTADISVFPNPSPNATSVRGLAAGQVIRITDAAGKEILQRKATSAVESIDISRWGAGTYFIAVSEKGSRIASLPLIKL